MSYDKNNIFAKILREEIPCKKVYENDHVLAFYDINPQKKVHVLVIPKKKIRTINDVSKDDAMLIGRMVLTAQKLAENLDIDESGYRLLWNTNKDAMQTIFHIHLHLIGGTKLKAI